jgi:hypothetical protein
VSIDEALVATIGVHTISVSGIGTVHAVSCWIDDEDGTTHTFILPPNVLHFPKSTVNLIIVTAFGKFFGAPVQEIRTSQLHLIL